MAAARLYDIKDAARYLHVAPSTLRYWESQGLVRAERNSQNDYRQYALHDLIEASEIAFYRHLGVPVRDLAGYRAMSIRTLDEALGRTEDGIEQRIRELEAMRARLARQRALNATADELLREGMRPGRPGIERLTEIDYDTPAPWALLLDEPWRYAVLVSADDPASVHEAFADEPDGEGPKSTGAVLWQRQPGNDARTCRSCLLKTTPSLDDSNAAELFAASAREGLRPQMLVGTYLLTASEAEGGPRWDFYRSWIVS